MLIVHSESDAELTAGFVYVDPNSLAYQNAVLEKKINSHQKLKDEDEGLLDGGLRSSKQELDRSVRKKDYSGIYSSEKNAALSASNSPSRINAPSKSMI